MIGAFDPRAHSKAGRAEKNNSTLLFQRTLFGKGSIPQEDVKQLTLVSAIKTITDVISSYTTGKENIKEPKIVFATFKKQNNNQHHTNVLKRGKQTQKK